jgi:hypothetical protein
MAPAHANIARKLAGRSDQWSSPVDPDLARAIIFHLRQMSKSWNKSVKEEVPLISKTKVLHVEVDASLSG